MKDLKKYITEGFFSNVVSDKDIARKVVDDIVDVICTAEHKGKADKSTEKRIESLLNMLNDTPVNIAISYDFALEGVFGDVVIWTILNHYKERPGWTYTSKNNNIRGIECTNARVASEIVSDIQSEIRDKTWSNGHINKSIDVVISGLKA